MASIIGESSMAASKQDHSTYKKIVQFCYAVSTDNEKALLELLRNGYDISARIASDNPFKSFSPKIVGMSALQFACENRSTKSVDVLLDNGADFTLKNSNGLTALHSALDYRCKSTWKGFDRILNPESAATRILSAHVKKNVTINPVNNHGLSHFHIACMVSHVEAVKLFLDNGVQVSDSVHADSPILPGYTALHIASRYGSFEVVQLLVDRGAHVHVRNTDGHVPLQLISARLEELSFLVMDSDDLYGESYDFGMELLSDTKNIASTLIQKTFNPDTLTNQLCIACVKKCTVTVNEIVDKGVDVNAQTNFGFTALHCAAFVDIKMMKLLLEHGADIFMRNDDGKTPLDICSWIWGYLIFRLLPCVQQIGKHILKERQSWRIALALRNNESLEELLSDDDVVQEINTPCVGPESHLWPGATPLHLAIIFARSYPPEHNSSGYIAERTTAILQTLLSRGASVTQKDVKGQTPVHLSFYLKQFGILRLLLNPDLRSFGFRHLVSQDNPSDDTGLSHFHLACMIGCRKSMTVLLSDHAPFDEPIKTDIEAKLDPAKPGIILKSGSTPMHIAARLSNIDAIKVLAAVGADISIKDAEGLTPIDLIASNSNFNELELVQLTFFLMSKYCFFDSNSVIPNEKIHLFETLGAALDPIVFHARYGKCLKPTRSQIMAYLETQSADEDGSLHRDIRVGYNCLEKMEEFMIRNWDTSTLESRCMNSLKGIFQKNSKYKLSNYECLRDFAETTLSECKCFLVMDVESQITTLHLACAINQGEWVEDLLRGPGIDVNCRLSVSSPFFPGSTPLHLAMRCCEKQTSKSYAEGVVKILLENGADPTIQDANDETPIHLADRFCLNTVKNLLRDERVAKKNIISKFGRSLFHIACSSNLPKIVKKFLQYGADPNELSHICDNAVWQTLPYDHFSSSYFHTPLQNAKNLGVIKVLLKYGADPKIEDYRGWTALHYATKIGRGADVIKMLVRDGGADVNSRSVLHLTALDLVVTKGLENDRDASQIRTLLEHGALVNHKNFEDGSTFARAIESSDVKLLQTLVKYGMDVNNLNEDKQSPLHQLFLNDDSLDSSDEYVTIIDLLCDKGIDIDCQDSSKLTPLHTAVQNCVDDGIIALLASGADINMTDCKGRTPFSLSMIDNSEDGGGLINTSLCQRNDIPLIFCRHIQKMTVFNIPVCYQNLTLERDVSPLLNGSEPTDNFMEKIKKSPELGGMKNIILEENVTLYDVMYMDSHQLATVVGNDQLKSLLSSKDFHEKFSELGGVLKLKFRIGQRRNLINLARKSLYLLLRMRLPVLCIELIVSTLSNEDLKTLVDVVGK